MISVPVVDPSQIAEARRYAAEEAARAGFDVDDTGRVALVATELASNIIKHGGGGELLIGRYEEPDSRGIELIALDKGPGIANLQVSIADGYSSSGTAGNGLGAIYRQSQSVDVASWPNLGTAILARLEPKAQARKKANERASWGAVTVAMPGQDVCGDAWSIDESATSRTLLVVDGLGHGPDAAEAAMQAVRVFHRHKDHHVDTLLEYIHGALRATRGAAVSIARIDRAAQKIVYAGIGNIAGVAVGDGGVKHMISLAGTAGHNARKIQAFEYLFTDGIVIMHSDGLGTSWNLDRYPGLTRAHPTLVAAVLYRDYARGRDDVTVLVARGLGAP